MPVSHLAWLLLHELLWHGYKTNLFCMQVYLWQFSKLLPTGLGRHIEGHGVLPVLYLSSWLLTSFASDFPLFFSSRVLDVVLTGSYPHAVLKVHKSGKPMGSCTAATMHLRSSSWVPHTYYRSVATCCTPSCLSAV